MKKLSVFSVISLLLICLSCTHESKKYRILTCGIRHESNTFSTLPTTAADFEILRGEEALKGEAWADRLRQEPVELIPTLHAYAWPGGVVERVLFDQLKNEILDGIRKAGALDAIYMDMHGALHVEGYEDAQASFIREIRDIIGDEVVISGSFDTHGNLSSDFIKHINLVTGYRTVPHRDGKETKVRAVTLLMQTLKQGLKPHIEGVTIPILVPGEKSITEVEPLHSIYAQIPDVATHEGLMDASILAGYAWADLPRSAMRVFVVAKDKRYAAEARKEACRLAQQVWDSRHELELDVPSGSIDEMITQSKKHTGKTVFISDSGDNTTAGAPGDNPQVLKALLNRQITNALVAGIVDAEALAQCVEASVGKTIALTLGGKKDTVFGTPLQIKGRIDFISPDSLLSTPRGAAVVDVQGVKVVLLKSRRSFTEIKDFQEIQTEPLSFGIVVVKLGYLYPELRDIAPLHLMALTSGFCNLDMTTLPFQRVNRPAYPLDKEMTWQANESHH